MTDLPSSGSDGGGLSRELDRLVLINSSPHQISKESQVLPTPSDGVLGDETTMERLPSTQLSSPQQKHGQQDGMEEIQQLGQRMLLNMERRNGIGDIRQQWQRKLLNLEHERQRIRLDTQKFINQQAMALHKNQQLLALLRPTSNPQAHEQAMLLHEQAQQHLAQLLQIELQPLQQPFRSQLLGSLPTTSNPQAHRLLDDIVDCSDLPVVGSSEAGVSGATSSEDATN